MPCEGLLAKNGSQAIEQPVEALHEVLPDIGTSKLRTALSLMREIAMVGRTRRGAVKLQARIADQHADGHLREAAQRYTAMAENDREILDRMIGYAQSAHCRWRVVLDYFAAQLGSIGTSWAAASSQYGHGDAGASISDELDGGVPHRTAYRQTRSSRDAGRRQRGDAGAAIPARFPIVVLNPKPLRLDRPSSDNRYYQTWHRRQNHRRRIYAGLMRLFHS